MAQYASSSKHLPRESIYPNPPSSDFLNALEDCVQATEGCSIILNNGLNKLNPGTKDLPRLTKIMNHKHHFLVLPEPTILAHKSALSTSLAPQIDQLIIKAENMVEIEKLKLNTMEERLKILESVKLPKQIDNSKLLNLTLSTTTTTTTTIINELNKSEDISCKINDLNLKDLSILQRKKIMMLKNKRERLEKELERLKVVVT